MRGGHLVQLCAPHTFSPLSPSVLSLLPLSLSLQLLDVSGGSGGAEHEAPVEAGGEGPAAHHRGGGGQLPRDAGAAADPEGAARLPRALDPGEEPHTVHAPKLRHFNNTERERFQPKGPSISSTITISSSYSGNDVNTHANKR